MTHFSVISSDDDSGFKDDSSLAFSEEEYADSLPYKAEPKTWNCFSKQGSITKGKEYQEIIPISQPPRRKNFVQRVKSKIKKKFWKKKDSDKDDLQDNREARDDLAEHQTEWEPIEPYTNKQEISLLVDDVEPFRAGSLGSGSNYSRQTARERFRDGHGQSMLVDNEEPFRAGSLRSSSNYSSQTPRESFRSEQGQSMFVDNVEPFRADKIRRSGSNYSSQTAQRFRDGQGQSTFVDDVEPFRAGSLRSGSNYSSQTARETIRVNQGQSMLVDNGDPFRGDQMRSGSNYSSQRARETFRADQGQSMFVNNAESFRADKMQGSIRSGSNYTPGNYSSQTAQRFRANQGQSMFVNDVEPFRADQIRCSIRGSRSNYGSLTPRERFRAEQEQSMLRVLFDFDACEENDVSVVRGELVKVLNKDDDDWWWIENSQRMRGFVPKSFLWPCGCYVCQKFILDRVTHVETNPSGYHRESERRQLVQEFSGGDCCDNRTRVVATRKLTSTWC